MFILKCKIMCLKMLTNVPKNRIPMIYVFWVILRNNLFYFSEHCMMSIHIVIINLLYPCFGQKLLSIIKLYFLNHTLIKWKWLFLTYSDVWSHELLNDERNSESFQKYYFLTKIMFDKELICKLECKLSWPMRSKINC